MVGYVGSTSLEDLSTLGSADITILLLGTSTNYLHVSDEDPAEQLACTNS